MPPEMEVMVFDSARGLDPAVSTAYWVYGNTVGTLIAVLLVPVLGALIDRHGYK